VTDARLESRGLGTDEVFDVRTTVSGVDADHWMLYILRDPEGRIVTYRFDTSVTSGQSRTTLWVRQWQREPQYRLDVYLYDSAAGRIDDTESEVVSPP
jgi:hypothetical protein